MSYYEDTEQKLWINHDVIQWLPLSEVLNDIKQFSYMSPDPIIIDVHRTPVGFDNDIAPWLLVSLINSTLGDYLVPSDLGQNVTLGDLWRMNKTIIVSYGKPSIRQKVPWLWPNIFQAWANAQKLRDLESYLDEQMTVRPKLDKLWAAMGHLTPTVWDIVLKADIGVR